MPLPKLAFHEPVEPFAAVSLQQPGECDATEKPGVRFFRDFILKEVGGGDFGILRGCDLGGPSEHKEGRAWDWKVSADDPEDAARAESVIAWLLGSDADGEPAALFRRAGLMYLIWDGRIWSASKRGWRDYTGASAHRDHVHFSFSWPGALAETSFFRPFGIEPGEREPPLPVPEPALPLPPYAVASAGGASLGALLALGAGLAAGWFGAHWALRRR